MVGGLVEVDGLFVVVRLVIVRRRAQYGRSDVVE